MSQWKNNQNPQFFSLEIEKNSMKNSTPNRISPFNNTNNENKKFFMRENATNQRRFKGKLINSMSEVKNKLNFTESSSVLLNNTKFLPKLNKPTVKKTNKNHFSMDFKNILPNLIPDQSNYQINNQIKYDKILQDQSPTSTNNLKNMIINHKKNKKTADFSIAHHHPYITEILEESHIKKPILQELYPQNLNQFKENEIDRKSKEISFSIEKIKENDHYSLYIAEILLIILKNSIENYLNEKLKNKIEYVQKDYCGLFFALFSLENGRFFDILFEVLIKNN